MFMRDYVDEVKKEIAEEKIGVAKEILKERLVEIELLEKALKEAKGDLQELLDKELEDVVTL